MVGLYCETNSKWSIQTPEWIQSIFGKTCIPVRIFSVSIVICPVYHSGEKKYRANRMFVLCFSILFNLNLVKRTFAIRFRYLPMNAVALRPVSGSYNYDTNDSKCRFQSTLPRGKWRIPSQEMITGLTFQSTLPRGKWHWTDWPIKRTGWFQSTLPRGKWLIQKIFWGSIHHFNPHFREGSDALTIFPLSRLSYFNPHFREGSDNFSKSFMISETVISIHTSAREVTSITQPMAQSWQISIHTSAREVTAILYVLGEGV